MAKEIGVYISKRSEELAGRIADSLEGADISMFPRNTKQFPDLDALIVVGGDGMTRRAMQRLTNQGQDTPVLLTKGGTNNATYRAVERAGHVVPLGQVVERLEDPTSLPRFNPGLVGDRVFVTDVGLGVCEPLIARLNSELKDKVDLKQLRPAMAALASWMAILLAKYPLERQPLDLYSVSPFYGKNVMFPEQDMFSPEITHAYIEESSKYEMMVKLLWVFACLGIGNRELSKSVLKVEQAPQFTVPYPVGEHMNSGSYRDDILGEVIVQRSPHSFPVAAIKIE